MKQKLSYFLLITVLAGFVTSISATHQFHHPSEQIKFIQNAKNPGKLVYEQYCANCHAEDPLIELNAPKFRHTLDWSKRLSQSEKTLLKHTLEGLNTMPPMGGCFECSEELLKNAIIYMLPQKK